MNRVKELRQEMGWRQSDLADRLGVRHQAVSKYETGALDLDTATIRRLCEIFGVTADYLLGFSDLRAAEISPEDLQLLQAYHGAPPEIRDIVDAALARYKEKEVTAAG